MQSVLKTSVSSSHPLALSFDQWSVQVQELYQLYYDLLVLRDRTTSASVGQAAAEGQKELMAILTHALEDIRNAPPANDPDALAVFLTGHFSVMRDVAARVRLILETEAPAAV